MSASSAVRGDVRREDLEALAGYALTAPTTHNTAPQRFRLAPEAGTLEILLDRRAVLPASDPAGRQAVISAGCVLAAAEVAARGLGWGYRLEVAAEPGPATGPLRGSASDPLASVGRLVLGRRDADPVPGLLTDLRGRRVLRCEYDHSLLPPGATETIHRVVAEVAPQLETHVLATAPALHAFAKHQEDADRFVLEQEEFARELSVWLLPNEDVTTPVGMRGAELGFDDAVTRRLRKGLAGTGSLMPDEVAGLATAAKVAMKSSSAAVVVAALDDTFGSRVAAGRAYLYAALALQRLGLVTAVHAAVTEVRHVGRIVAATVLHTRARPLVVFRVGRPADRADLGRRRSARPPVADLLVV